MPKPAAAANSAVHAAYPYIAPLVETALPDHASGQTVTAREMFTTINVSTIGVIRTVLRELAKEGRAMAHVKPHRRDDTINHYCKAPEAPCLSP